MELEGRPRPLLMLKEWLELEYSAELSRNSGFGCYPRSLAAELRGGSGRRRNGDVIARVSAAVRAALFRPSGREGEAPALSRNLSGRLRRGFWRKRSGDGEEADRTVGCCSAPVVGGRKVVRCGTACHLDEVIEQEQRLSPVSVMDFLSQDEDGGDDDDDEDDSVASSPTFQQSLANIRRVSQQLLQKIRQFEQLAELDTSDEDDPICANEGTEDAQVLLDLLEESSPGSTHCFQKLLVDFFYDGLPSCQGERLDGPDRGKSLLGMAKTWLDGQDYSSRSDKKAVFEEIERIGWWRCFREDEQKLVAVDLEGDIFCSLVAELVEELH